MRARYQLGMLLMVCGLVLFAMSGMAKASSERVRERTSETFVSSSLPASDQQVVRMSAIREKSEETLCRCRGGSCSRHSTVRYSTSASAGKTKHVRKHRHQIR